MINPSFTQQSRALAISAIVVVSLLAICPRSRADDSLSRRKQAVLALQRKGFFKNATCREIADFVLTRLGLPRLGAAQPVMGFRGNVNRGGEDKSPPEFVDEIIGRGTPSVRTKVTARGDANQWILTVQREPVPGRLPRASLNSWRTESQIRFKAIFRDNIASCEFSSVSFLETKPGRVELVKRADLDSERCLDAYTGGSVFLPPGMSEASLEALMDDCALGLRYSLKAKQLLIQSSAY